MYTVIRYTLLNNKELKYDTYALQQYIMHFLCFVVHFAYFVALLLYTLYALYITQYTSSQQQNTLM